MQFINIPHLQSCILKIKQYIQFKIKRIKLQRMSNYINNFL